MCVLHVSSANSSFQDFLEQTTLPVYQSHEKGEKRFVTKEVIWENYGFSCDVSERDWSDLDGQFEDAEAFLEKYEEEVKKLHSSFEIDDIRLDFPFECRLGQDGIIMQGSFLPSSLALLCGKYHIGIALSHYPGCEHE